MPPDTKEILDEWFANTIKQEKIYTLIGTATNVDETKRVCDFTPIGDEGQRFDVRLQSAESQTVGLVLIPKEGSDIAISFMNKTQAFVSLTSELDKILIDTTLVQFNGGDNGGLIKISELLARINKLEKAMDTHVHPTAATGAPSPPTPIPSVLPVGQTTQVQIEDTKVTH